MKTKEIKLSIIENFIDNFTSDEVERKRMKESASLYVDEDHVDEIKQSMPTEIAEAEAKALLTKAGYFTENLWHVDDVKVKFKCTDEEAQKVLNQALRNEATMEQIWFAIDFHGDDIGLKRVG